MSENHGGRRQVLQAIGAGAASAVGIAASNSVAADPGRRCSEKTYKTLREHYDRPTAERVCSIFSRARKRFRRKDKDEALAWIQRQIRSQMPETEIAEAVRGYEQTQERKAETAVDPSSYDVETIDADDPRAQSPPGQKVQINYDDYEQVGWIPSGDVAIADQQKRIRCVAVVDGGGTSEWHGSVYGADYYDYPRGRVRITVYYKRDGFTMGGKASWHLFHRVSRRPETEQSYKLDQVDGLNSSHGHYAQSFETYLDPSEPRYEIGWEVRCKATALGELRKHADFYHPHQHNGELWPWHRHSQLTDGIYIESI